LFLAAQYGRKECVSLLLVHGCEVDKRSYDGTYKRSTHCSYTIFMHHIHALYSCTICIHYIHALHPYTTSLIHYTHTLHSYTIFIHSIHALHPYTTSIHNITLHSWPTLLHYIVHFIVHFRSPPSLHRLRLRPAGDCPTVDRPWCHRHQGHARHDGHRRCEDPATKHGP
jgi:hypothetical protein